MGIIRELFNEQLERLHLRLDLLFSDGQPYDETADMATHDIAGVKDVPQTDLATSVEWARVHESRMSSMDTTLGAIALRDGTKLF